ncbi:methyltransferase FkbM domain protein [SAR86 cluster bacterium SAR86E]|uniref:Methyltransferase FkbM domain protein n=1 Tax=SAR86 cluster bacterium SAR86E TaxID=1208365 RepID=K6G4M2_9GAMM|nr:methyltransferase FkbM domain protein [SAR86 cluster bacterium SAR86E]
MFKKIRSYIRNYPLIRRFVGHTLPSTGFFDNTFRNWKVDDIWRKRIDICLSSPDNFKIPRCAGAGSIKNGKQLMHNGIKVNVGSYYGPEKTVLLTENNGVHEPQEELLFQLVLEYIDRNNKSKPTMIELGSFWAFYSLWFKQKFTDSNVFMVEPESFNIESGKRNFKLNNKEGTFINAFVSDIHENEKTSRTRTVSVDGLKEEFAITNIDILHSDIQGYELAMLEGAKDILSNHSAEFLFISTHSNELHYDCIQNIKDHDYRIICDIDLNDTFSEDGLIVACCKNSKFEFTDQISKRSLLL